MGRIGLIARALLNKQNGILDRNATEAGDGGLENINNKIGNYGQRNTNKTQGGTHVVVDHCKFIYNGRSDPSSHIDWEDGRQNSQGHIVRYCDFISDKVNGQTVNGYCRNITIHDCYFEGGSFGSGSESVMQRTYHNVFNNTSVSMSSKADHVFAGNLLNTTPTLNNGVEGTYIISVDNKIITE